MLTDARMRASDKDLPALAKFACYRLFSPISEFFYKLIRFSLHSPIEKSDNEIGPEILLLRYGMSQVNSPQ